MIRSMVRCIGFLGLVALLALPAQKAGAQSGMVAPQFPAPGGWAEVLTVTDNWLVLVNQDGQQFPVSRDAITLFVIRWPTTPQRIAPNSLIEASGIDLSTKAVQTDHVDVYYGAAANLVTPGATQIMGQGRVLTPFDLWSKNRFGLNFYKMMNLNEVAMPLRLHVVGPPVNTVPLQIGIAGNSFITVVPGPNGLSMSQVTMGTFSVLRPGDIAYVINRQGRETPRSLKLAQLVVYKKVPLDQFH